MAVVPDKAIPLIAATVLASPAMTVSNALAAEAPATPHSFELGLEFGPFWTASNDVRVPGDSGTKFDMTSLTGSGPEPAVRLDAGWQINEKHAVRAVIAPLEVSGTGELATATNFAGEVFAPGTTEATYKFSTYKLTYRYTFLDRDSWRLNVGFTGVIRDANIELQQGPVRANDDDVGFVPALHFSSAYRFSDRWRFLLDFDGLAGGPGRLIDLSFKTDYALSDRWRIGGGYRLLEGGVDIDEVYNFAWLNLLVFDVRYAF